MYSLMTQFITRHGELQQIVRLKKYNKMKKFIKHINDILPKVYNDNKLWESVLKILKSEDDQEWLRKYDGRKNINIEDDYFILSRIRFVISGVNRKKYLELCNIPPNIHISNLIPATDIIFIVQNITDNQKLTKYFRSKYNNTKSSKKHVNKNTNTKKTKKN